jgi:hypothetical protein
MNKLSATTMNDLIYQAETFETSAGLRRAASALSSLGKGRNLTEDERFALMWAGDLLLEVDFNTRAKQQSVGSGLAVQATSVRPTFYSSLLRIASRFRDAGLKDQDAIAGFLLVLLNNLAKAGSPGRGSRKLKPTECDLGSYFLEEIADSLLVQLGNNGNLIIL